MELAVLFCLITTALAIFAPAFWRRLQTNKVAEASELLSELHRRAETYYATDWGPGRRGCLPPSAGPTPAKPTMAAERVDFTAEGSADRATWEALGFSPTRPIRFSYTYTTTKHGCGLPAEGETVEITLSAEGNLDGDAEHSRFERSAVLTPDGELVPVGPLHVHQRIE